MRSFVAAADLVVLDLEAGLAADSVGPVEFVVLVVEVFVAALAEAGLAERLVEHFAVDHLDFARSDLPCAIVDASVAQGVVAARLVGSAARLVRSGCSAESWLAALLFDAASVDSAPLVAVAAFGLAFAVAVDVEVIERLADEPLPGYSGAAEAAEESCLA